VAEKDAHFAALAGERLRLAVRERDVEAEGAGLTPPD